jgi:hypothetical protein
MKLLAEIHNSYCYSIHGISNNKIKFMRAQDFDNMEATEKLIAISEQAVFLLQKTNGYFRIILYQIEGIYVEIYFDTVKLIYVCIRAFEGTRGLEGYLEQIDISELYSLT